MAHGKLPLENFPGRFLSTITLTLTQTQGDRLLGKQSSGRAIFPSRVLIFKLPLSSNLILCRLVELFLDSFRLIDLNFHLGK